MSSTNASLVSTIDPPSFGPGHPVFSHVTVVPFSDTVKMITVAGQVAITAEGKTPDGLSAQMKLCLERLSTCLEAAGAGVKDMTRLMYYFTEKAWVSANAQCKGCAAC